MLAIIHHSQSWFHGGDGVLTSVATSELRGCFWDGCSNFSGSTMYLKCNRELDVKNVTL